MKAKRRVDQKELVDTLGISPIGGHGWHSGKDFLCPECKKGDEKFGLLIKEEGGLVNCWRCGYKDSLFNYLFRVGQQGLIHGGKKYEYSHILENKISAKHLEAPAKPEENLPHGFTRIINHPYLEERGFTPEQFEQFEVGVTKSPMEPAWRGKIIFQIFNNGVRVGYLGRSTKTKQWHDKNLADSREGLVRLDLRYKNSDGDFNDFLGGLDDIHQETHTVIIVEGLMDKANIDRLLDTHSFKGVQVVYTFGSSISDAQIALLRSKKNVQTVIILFDPDAMKKVFGYCATLQKSFPFVFVAVATCEHDPGDMTRTELCETLNNLRNPDEFYSGSLITKNLRNEN